MVQPTTHFVVFYPDERRLAVERAESLHNVMPDFHSLLSANTMEEIHVSVQYGDTLYDGIVISACGKATAQQICESCVAMREKNKSLQKMLKAYPRVVSNSKRLKFVVPTVSNKIALRVVLFLIPVHFVW